MSSYDAILPQALPSTYTSQRPSDGRASDWKPSSENVGLGVSPIHLDESTSHHPAELAYSHELDLSKSRVTAGKGEIDLVIEHVPSSPAVSSRRWTRAAWLFFLSVALFVFSTSAILLYIEIVESNSQDTFPQFINLNLMLNAATLISEVFLLYSAWMAIRSRNMICIIGVLAFNIFLVIAGFVEAWTRDEPWFRQWNPDGTFFSNKYTKVFPGPLNELLWAIPAIDLGFHLVGDLAAYRLFRELGWYCYRKVSADLELRKYYRRYLILSSLTLYAGFFSCLQSFFTATEAYATAAYFFAGAKGPHLLSLYVASPVLALFYNVALVVQANAIRSENRTLSLACLTAQVLHIGWTIYLDYASILILLLPRLWDRPPSDMAPEDPPISYYYWTILVFPRFILTLIVYNFLVVATLVYSVLTVRGFGKGLVTKYSTAAVGKFEPIDLSGA